MPILLEAARLNDGSRRPIHVSAPDPPPSLANQASLKNPNTSDEKKEEIRAKLKQLVRIRAFLVFMKEPSENDIQGEPIPAEAEPAIATTEEA